MSDVHTAESDAGDDLAAHFRECDCHDSWDQCPCTESGHPLDGSCGCCPRGTGLCGPFPLQAIRELPEVTTPIPPAKTEAAS